LGRKELIDRNQGKISKMPICYCTCGSKILIVPDLPAMNKAIRNHIIEHKKLTGQSLTEEDLTNQVIKVISQELLLKV
jgi:hypothetical protein